jgi:bifunctional DNase/RNase
MLMREHSRAPDEVALGAGEMGQDGGMNDGGQVPVTVSGLAVDTGTSHPVVLVKEVEGDRVLPIWIGPAEASAIAFELAGIRLDRPMTHDLLKTIFDGVEGKILRVAITDLLKKTYYAVVEFEVDGDVIELDARPSDSIALALKAKAPIFASEKVMDATSMNVDLKDAEERTEDLCERLQRINPEDFGSFRLGDLGS